MNDSLILSWLRGDPDDAELFDFRLASHPSPGGQCYQSMSQIKRLSSCIDENINGPLATKYTLSIGMPGINVAGGFLTIDLEKSKEHWNVAVALSSFEEKKHGSVGANLHGTVQYDDLNHFALQLRQMSLRNAETCELRIG